MFNELLKYDSKTTLSKNFFDFYQNYETYLSKLKLILNRLDNEIIEPMNTFIKHLTEKMNSYFQEFKNVLFSFNQ